MLSGVTVGRCSLALEGLVQEVPKAGLGASSPSGPESGNAAVPIPGRVMVVVRARGRGAGSGAPRLAALASQIGICVLGKLLEDSYSRASLRARELVI